MSSSAVPPYSPEHIHLIGIGGAGLSAIATVLLARGKRVSGSDRAEAPVLARLRSAGAEIYIGHSANNVTSPDLVLRSSAVPDSNPEVQVALQRGIPVVKRQDYLAQLLDGQKTIAVAGTHGKTTTSGLISYVLYRANLRPGFIVGGELPDLATNAAHGDGDYFVIEADEYDRMFLGLKPYIAIVTNVEFDHPDIYPTEAAVQSAFAEFIGLLPLDGLLIACADDPGALRLAGLARERGVAVQTYSVQPNSSADWVAEEVKLTHMPASGGAHFLAIHSATGKTLGPLRLQLEGVHNIANAMAMVVLAQALQIPYDKLLTGLAGFRGAGRRFEWKGTAGGVAVLDDYAHHPTEIRATLASARRRFPSQRIVAMFQPHTFSRTRALLENFANSFSDADVVVITEIFAAREDNPDGLSGATILKLMRHPSAHFIPTLAEAEAWLGQELRPNDVFITLGAGNGWQVGEHLLAKLSQG